MYANFTIKTAYFDLNNDGKVDVLDRDLVARFITSGSYLVHGDFNFDGALNSADLAIINNIITQPSTTVSFTIEGQDSYAYNVGQTNYFKWSSTNADTFSSYSVANNPTQCGQGVWVANTARGESRTYLESQWAGCIWDVTYTAKNSTTGQSDSKTVKVSVNPLTTTQPSITVLSPNGGETYSNAGGEIKFVWKQTGGGRVSAFLEFTDGALCYMGHAPAENGGFSFYPLGGFPCNFSSFPTDRSIVPGEYRLVVRLHTDGNIFGTPAAKDTSDSHFKIISSDVSQPSPTVSFTIEGQDSYAYNVGQTNYFKWSSTNADTFSSYSVANYPTQCGQGVWVANTARGESRTYLESQWAGCIWTLTYTATNSTTGQSASKTVKVTVNPLTTQPSITVLSPNGGETWIQGIQQKISWAVSPNIQNSIGRFQVHLMDSSGAQRVGRLEGGTGGLIGPDQRFLIYTFDSSIATGQYRIQVTVISIDGITLATDLSDAPFTITAPVVTSTPHTDRSLTIDSVSLSSPGVTMNIEDEYHVVPGAIVRLSAVASASGVTAVGFYDQSRNLRCDATTRQAGNVFSCNWTAVPMTTGTYGIFAQARNNNNGYMYGYYTLPTVMVTAQVTGNILGAESFYFTQFLEQGSYGNEVKELQKILNVAGYYSGTIDGNFGLQTKEALIKFQTVNKLKSDGLVGYEVRTFLNK